MTLFLPVGPPGVGKSTLVEDMRYSKAITKDSIVCPDDFRVMLTGEKSQEENDLVFYLVHKIVDVRLRRGLDVWVDATNLSNTRAFRRKAIEHGHEIIMIKMRENSNLHLLKSRNFCRPARDQVPESVLEKFSEKWDNFQFPEGVTILEENELREKYGLLHVGPTF